MSRTVITALLVMFTIQSVNVMGAAAQIATMPEFKVLLLGCGSCAFGLCAAYCCITCYGKGSQWCERNASRAAARSPFLTRALSRHRNNNNSVHENHITCSLCCDVCYEAGKTCDKKLEHALARCNRNAAPVVQAMNRTELDDIV
jgi:hypothetical protein